MIEINGRWINPAHVLWAEIFTTPSRTSRTPTQRLCVCFTDGSRWFIDENMQTNLDAIKQAIP